MGVRSEFLINININITPPSKKNRKETDFKTVSLLAVIVSSAA